MGRPLRATCTSLTTARHSIGARSINERPLNTLSLTDCTHLVESPAPRMLTRSVNSNRAAQNLGRWGQRTPMLHKLCMTLSACFDTQERLYLSSPGLHEAETSALRDEASLDMYLRYYHSVHVPSLRHSARPDLRHIEDEVAHYIMWLESHPPQLASLPHLIHRAYTPLVLYPGIPLRGRTLRLADGQTQTIPNTWTGPHPTVHALSPPPAYWQHSDDSPRLVDSTGSTVGERLGPSQTSDVRPHKDRCGL
jgi:hypothetical protein